MGFGRQGPGMRGLPDSAVGPFISLREVIDLGRCLDIAPDSARTTVLAGRNGGQQGLETVSRSPRRQTPRREENTSENGTRSRNKSSKRKDEILSMKAASFRPQSSASLKRTGIRGIQSALGARRRQKL
ncbi:unnamed protein product, partial [Amoebophrya sp. A25]|eukprot:GSA25T00026312001.1